MGAILAVITAWRPLILPLVVRLLAGLGFAAVTYTGVGSLLDTVTANLWASMGAAPAGVLTILQLARVDDALTVIISAVAAKLALKGLTAAGVLKRVSWTPS